MALLDDDIDSACSTPYASAPSSPTRRPGYFFSAPASPMHYMLHSAPAPTALSDASVSSGNFEFDFSAPSPAASADELFLNGQIRPTSRLEPLIDTEEENDSTESEDVRGRELRTRSRSMHRRTRSMSPLRNRSDHKKDSIRKDLDLVVDSELNKADEIAPTSAEPVSTSRSSSSGRNSKRWVFIKELLYRSKSEGRGSTGSKEKFWQNLSFSPSSSSKDKTKLPPPPAKKPANGVGVGKRRGPAPSAHERHYTTNRAAAEEMRKRTFLPYRQGLLGCLGFGSRSYGAVNGFARAFNPVSTR